jgi:putative membrane protein
MDAFFLRYRWPLAALLVMAGLGLSRAPLSPQVWWVSALAILLFSAPVFVGAIRWLGRWHGIVLLVGLGVYAFVLESLAVATGFPYGHFGYSDVLGPPLLDLAPPTVLVAWTPLILGCVAATRKVWQAVALLVAVDLVLDPAAVHLGFWSWDEPGIYYGVPPVNFLGWVLSGCIAVLALRRLPRPLPGILRRNLWLVVVFWTAVNAWSGQWIPVVVGIGIAVLVGRDYGRLDDYRDRDRRRDGWPGGRRPARPTRARRDPGGEERAARRSGERVRGGRVPLRHGPVLVPDAGRLRALLRPAG